MSEPLADTTKIEEITEGSTAPEIHDDDEHDGSEDEDTNTPQSSSGPSKKKKKKKSKAAKALNALSGKFGSDQIPQELVNRVMDEVKNTGQIADSEVTEENVRLALEEMKITEVVKGKVGIGGHNAKDMGSHKFWGTQPVPQLGEAPAEEDGYIEPSVPREEVQQEPYKLPGNFEWSSIDIDDPNQNKEVYDLLSLNYVEDDDASFRFQYTAEFLNWALRPPGYHKEWHVGVRVSSNKKLVGFIAGVPIKVRVRKNILQMTEINFLCVHKKLRSKRLAPVLIKEVTRQVHLKGIFQAIYTAGVIIPTPVTTCRYMHRALNVPKLIDVGFTYVPRSMTLARMIKNNQVPEKPTLPIREIEERDVVGVTDLFRRFMGRYDMVPIMSIEEVRHQFISGLGRGAIGSGGPGRYEGQVTWTYVIEDPETKRVTDFFSFYSLPSTVISNPKHGVLEAAYLYYYASEVAFESDNDEKLKKRLNDLISDAVIVAANARFDVFNALTMMDNIMFLQDQKFGPGDGHLNFYLYNWRTTPLTGEAERDGQPVGRGVGVVML